MQMQSKLPHIGTTIFTVVSQLASEHGAINLGQGFPDFSAPARLLEETARAMAEGLNQYAPMSGIAPLRHAIAQKVLDSYGINVDAETEITVTSGATEAVFNAIHALVQAGEEVIVLDPAYDCYVPAIELAGARAVHVPLDAHTFAVDWDKVKAAISAKTRLLIINSPHNPCGVILSAQDMQILSQLLANTAIYLLSDEVYEHIIYDNARHESALIWPQLRERAFVVSSFGKTYHCTGWKIGFAIAPPALTAEFRKIHQYNTFSSFAPAQYGFAAMLRDEPQHHQQLSAFYQQKRDRFRAQLVQTRLKPLPVAGGYFQLVDYSSISDLPDDEFVRWLIREKGVAGIPMSSFYAHPEKNQRLLRLCFAKNEATLDAAIERLRAL